ncbi:MAG: hypothetical protein M1834_009672 [Cirrosporium novae-zelandiae]|nr:MAG: hypothetical protein M1834_009672 [Cirrosporium novae-zelandiae]
MLDLGLEVSVFAATIGHSLAIMHLAARVDARDIEFVLGRAPSYTHYQLPSYAELTSIPEPKPDNHDHDHDNIEPEFKNRLIRVWMLDFNECLPIELNEDGVDAAVEAIFLNDAYYPRPPSPSPLQKPNIPALTPTTETTIDKQNETVWPAFRDSYLRTAKLITAGWDTKDLDLDINSDIDFPQRFIDKLVARAISEHPGWK